MKFSDLNPGDWFVFKKETAEKEATIAGVFAYVKLSDDLASFLKIQAKVSVFNQEEIIKIR